MINEEYKVWKKNSPFLYDLVITKALDWPSLTCQWFPDVEDRPGKNYKTQRLLLGTNTNDEEPNYLMIANIQLPKNQEKDIDLRKYEETTNEIGGYGGFNDAHIHITQKIVHDGEVNRARYQYDNPNVIATKSRSGDVYVFDRTMHESFPKENERFNPALRLKGHTKEGFGLEWNPHTTKSNHLLSAGYDGKVIQWDIADATKENRTLQPLQVYTGHTAAVNDISWHMKHDSIFASVGDDKKMKVWDTRDDPSRSFSTVEPHHGQVSCVGFCPSNEWIVATGSSDKTAKLWDLRNLNQSLHTLHGHTGEIIQLAWSPHHEAILATASNEDRRIYVWDLAQIPTAPDQSEEDAKEGPPELLFIHGGHTAGISDFGWNPADPWMLASTSDDNIIQFWQIVSGNEGFWTRTNIIILYSFYFLFILGKYYLWSRTVR
ncbi:WD40-repeat-containing domain protein [Mycotypha africana]|uniref:WD40-repeat-containing domain protein n=1 Tax=Mycotypha africana TaxID=64632 RepID=UPI0023014CFC|nr:WD40-repeat-containing domain protein [Mycotypha africana]KAI8982164.1 WD40-repeat-containing domain protein [Mycotypha africana]